MEEVVGPIKGPVCTKEDKKKGVNRDKHQRSDIKHLAQTQQKNYRSNTKILDSYVTPQKNENANGEKP